MISLWDLAHTALLTPKLTPLRICFTWMSAVVSSFNEISKFSVEDLVTNSVNVDNVMPTKKGLSHGVNDILAVTPLISHSIEVQISARLQLLNMSALLLAISMSRASQVAFSGLCCAIASAKKCCYNHYNFLS